MSNKQNDIIAEKDKIDIDTLAHEMWMIKKTINSAINLQGIYKIKAIELRRKMLRHNLNTYHPNGENYEIRIYSDGVGIVYAPNEK